VVNVATDNAAYFEQIVRVMNGWKSVPPLVLPPEAQTEFEKIFLAKGEPVYRARWVKP
jgi:tRNA G46 methylase TrmB